MRDQVVSCQFLDQMNLMKSYPLCTNALLYAFWYQRPTEPTHTQNVRSALCIAKKGSRRVTMRRIVNFQSCFMSLQTRLCKWIVYSYWCLSFSRFLFCSVCDKNWWIKIKKQIFVKKNIEENNSIVSCHQVRCKIIYQNSLEPIKIWILN